ncbi:hypothetical protein ACH492_08530 [Streptomyces sp. NPDC019443]|uniref:hypothetical protein n=1 Tax=Streptomyces sp. NPDC019443 TaxID=3365061 RepID=UPI0037A2ABC6
MLERGSDMVLAAHFTPVAGGWLTATTVESVRFTRPGRIDFRLVRGPVPAVVESFRLSEYESGTRLEYEGELGTDVWALGQRWGQLVAGRWVVDRARPRQDGPRLLALPLLGAAPGRAE